MTLQDTLRLGPLNLPVRYLLFLCSFLFGYLVMSLLLLRSSERRRATGGRLTNALVAFIIIWKLEPVVAALFEGVVNGHLNLKGAVLQLLVPGGDLAALLGAAGALVYLLLSIGREKREDSSFSVRWQARFRGGIGVVAAILPAALFYLAGSLVLGTNPALSRAHGGPSSAASALERPIGTAVGDRAPGFTASTLDGALLSSNQSHAKILVLNFWATWCPPCRAELPDLVRFAATRRPGSVAVWAVNMTATESSLRVVRDFSKANHIDFPVLLDPKGAIARAYRVTAVPTTFVISDDGIILAKQVGAMSPSWLRNRTSVASQ